MLKSDNNESFYSYAEEDYPESDDSSKNKYGSLPQKISHKMRIKQTDESDSDSGADDQDDQAETVDQTETEID